MRILIVNWSIRKVAGTEDYLNNLLPELLNRGDELAFAHQVDVPRNREEIPLPEGAPCWDVSKLGRKRALEAMKAWEPDIIYAHGELDHRFEAGFLEIAPAIYFAHNYYGTCISGLKTFQFPIVQPCNRRFGAACLLHYFPRRCGGRNPITMLRLFRRNSRRLANFPKYQAIVTHSNHMRQEYIRNGIPEEQVHNFLYEIGPRRNSSSMNEPVRAPARNERGEGERRWRLLFVGRMELLKGGATLLEALPMVAKRLDQPLRLVLAGDGPKRKDWQRRASRVAASHPSIEFEFTGWVDKKELERRYVESDLLVVPSLWPEPFGRIGPEAGLRGVPVAAFAVGGVTDWLVDGENGFLAPGDPPTAEGLADAIVKSLENPAVHGQLRANAVRIASQFNMRHHMEALGKVFDAVCPPQVR